jgi:hypothetical protein
LLLLANYNLVGWTELIPGMILPLPILLWIKDEPNGEFWEDGLVTCLTFWNLSVILLLNFLIWMKSNKKFHYIFCSIENLKKDKKKDNGIQI